jgi:hypothetical protein
MRLRALMLPYVSKAEQKDIERRYKKPIRRAIKKIEIEVWNGRLNFLMIFLKFLKKNNVNEDYIVAKIKLVLRKLRGENVNINIKKLRG